MMVSIHEMFHNCRVAMMYACKRSQIHTLLSLQNIHLNSRLQCACKRALTLPSKIRPKRYLVTQYNNTITEKVVFRCRAPIHNVVTPVTTI